MDKKTVFDYFGEIAEILNTACDELHSIDFRKLSKDLTTLIEYYDKIAESPAVDGTVDSMSVTYVGKQSQVQEGE